MLIAENRGNRKIKFSYLCKNIIPKFAIHTIVDKFCTFMTWRQKLLIEYSLETWQSLAQCLRLLHYLALAHCKVVMET